MKRAREPTARGAGDGAQRNVSAARARGKQLYGRVKQVRKRHAHTGVSRLGQALEPLSRADAALLLPGQRRAVDAVLAGRSVLLTGCGGTGKSHVIRTLKAHLTSACKVEAHVVATTGVAAVALKGVTVHSFFALGMGDKDVDEYVKRATMFHRLRHKLQGLHVLIIDEVSMLTERVFTVMDAMLRAARQVNEPMGGVVVVACGDFLQLPVVHRGYDAPPPPVCTTAVWDAVHFDVHVLLQSVRHATDEQWERMLGRIRKGRATAQDMAALDARCVPDEDVPRDATWLLPTRAGVEHMNARAIAELQRPVVHLTPVLSAHFTVTCLGSRPEWVDWGRMGAHLPRSMRTAMLEADMPGHTKPEALPPGVGTLFPDDLPPAPQNAALAALRNTLQGVNGVKLCVGVRVLLTCKLAEVPPDRELVNGSQGTVVGWARCAPHWGAYVHEMTQSEDEAQRNAAVAGRAAPTAQDYTRVVVQPVDTVFAGHTALTYAGERVLPLPDVPMESILEAGYARSHCRAVLTPGGVLQADSTFLKAESAYGTRHADAFAAQPPVQGAVLRPVQDHEPQDVVASATVPSVPAATLLTVPCRVTPSEDGDDGVPDAVFRQRHAACAAASTWAPIVRFDNGVQTVVAPQFFGVDVPLPESDDTVAHSVRVGAWCCPLLAAAAITVHKAQGMSMDAVAIALANMRATGQAYVALSRARTLAGVYISHIDADAIKADADTVHMYDSWEIAAAMLDDEAADAAAADGGSAATTAPAPDASAPAPDAAAELSQFAYGAPTPEKP
uniref:DNA helicase Pif1-like DEAD-box helicase domain-containing protein n=1 Tax=viral metagenome TaxID=1070528 RepID=A0A6C0AT64_9ZZZZ